MPDYKIYLNKEELACVKAKGAGWLRRVVPLPRFELGLTTI